MEYLKKDIKIRKDIIMNNLEKKINHKKTIKKINNKN